MNIETKRALVAALLVAVPAACSAPADRAAPPAAYASYWNAIVGDLAAASVANNYAAMALVDGDRDRATQLIADARKFDEKAKRETADAIPAAWRSDGIGRSLARATDLLAAANALGASHGEASNLVDAQSDRQAAALDILAAGAEARKSYARIGGRASDLKSLQNATQSTLTAFDSMEGHSGDDDQ